MIDLGVVFPGETIYVPFDSYDGATGASEAITGLAVTDIEIYKNGSTTQRASDAGYTLLDTDGIDFDSVVGLNGFSINLADNTDAGFYTAGARYWVVVSSVTADGQTVNFTAATFKIGHPSAIVNTTIATLASQTSFTLTAGSADDNAYIGCTAYIHDIASAVQCCMGTVSAYTGATRTVTLAADPAIFTVAAGDNIMILPRVNVYSLGGVAQTGRDLGTSVLLSSGTGTGQLDFTSGVVKTNLAQILGTALTETSGQIAAAFKKFFNVAAPTATCLSLPDAVPGAAGGVFIAGTNAATTVTTALTADITGSLSGSVGSVTGAVGSVTGAVGSVTGNVGGNVAGSVGSVIGAVGSVTGAVGSVTGAVGSVTGNVGGNVIGSIGSLAAQAKADVNAEVVDAVNVDTIPEMAQGVPPATPTMRQAAMYPYMALRNKLTVTATEKAIYNDAGTKIAKKGLADDGSVYTEDEMISGA